MSLVMPSSHSSNSRNAVTKLLCCISKLARRCNYMHMLLCALLWVTGPAGLSVARSEPGDRRNVYDRAEKSIGEGREKVHSVPETINSGGTGGVLILLFG